MSSRKRVKNLYSSSVRRVIRMDNSRDSRQRSADFRSDDISVRHSVAKRRDGARSVASCMLPPLCRHSLSLNKLEADILQGGPGRLHKKSPTTHMRKFAARASLTRSRPFVGPRAWPSRVSIFRFRESVIQPLCARSRFSSTRQWASALVENHFVFPPIPHCAYIRNRYNEPSAEHNYFALLTRSPWLSLSMNANRSRRSRGTVTWTTTRNSAAFYTKALSKTCRIVKSTNCKLLTTCELLLPIN